MRLTVYTDYSLRLLMYLAASAPARATIGEIAEAHAISRNHLTKVAHNMGLAGFIETTRGKGGGMRLARPADQIIVGEVVRATEPDWAIMQCFPPLQEPCRMGPHCGLKAVLATATMQFLAELDRHTLADLVTPKAQVRDRLGIAVVRMPESSAAR